MKVRPFTAACLLVGAWLYNRLLARKAWTGEESACGKIERHDRHGDPGKGRAEVQTNSHKINDQADACI